MAAPSTPASPFEEGRLPIHRRMLSDERLARLVEHGSENAFAVIYERYHQRLYRYCRSLLRDGDDAYDALQSTLANALAALQRGRRDAPLRPWLFRIAHNESISLIRRRGPERGSFDAVESCVPSAEARADERARLAMLVSDLGELPERQRAVLLMREVSGLSRKDIASALGLSVQTVGRALFAARRSLGEFEEGRAMVCEQAQRSISLADGRLPTRARAHVRDCATCAAFAASIPARRADLQALAPPLAPIPAAALLAVVHGTASTQGAGGGGAMAAGLSGKLAGATLAAKALATVTVVAVAGASVTGLAPKLTGSAKSSLETASSAHASAAKHHRRQTARTPASRARGRAVLAPAARIDVGTPASAGASAAAATSDAPAVSAGSAGAAGSAKATDTAVPAQDLPSRGGPPVHPAHPHGAGPGAVNGKPTTATNHGHGAGATGAAGNGHHSGATGATGNGHGSGGGTGGGHESAGAASGKGHAGGGQGQTSEPPSAGPSGNPEHGHPAEAPSAPPSHPEPSSAAGEKQSPPAHEEAGGHGHGEQHGGTTTASSS